MGDASWPGRDTICIMSAAYAFTVAVEARFLPDQSDLALGQFGFAYTITIQNVGQVAAQLIARHWVITHASGLVEEVKGLGVVGQQPLLQPGEAFEYTSGCRLRTATGSMEGSYFCVAEDGHRFEVPIPAFKLDADDDIVASSAGPRVLH